MKLSQLIPGLLGGLVAVLVDKDMNVKDGFKIITVGGITSMLLVPALQEHMNLSINLATFLGFCTGIIARNVIVKTKPKVEDRLSEKILKEL